MIELGKMQKLQVVSKNQQGYLLNLKNDQGKAVLLPGKPVPSGLKPGDIIEVFVYQDAENRTIATLKRPKLTLGELAVLRVVDITNFGSFLDWGLEKDLLLPVKEQVGKVKIGSAYLVGLYLNSSQRLCATMKIYNWLKTDSPYKKNDKARGTVYQLNRELGAFVAVDNMYHGMIPKQESYGRYEVGDEIDVIIKKVRQDGKLELSLRQEAYNEIENDARALLSRMKANGGSLKINDNSTPEKIKAELNISKRAFKRAVGKLLKEGAIKITDEGIKMMW